MVLLLLLLLLLLGVLVVLLVLAAAGVSRQRMLRVCVEQLAQGWQGRGKAKCRMPTHVLLPCTVGHCRASTSYLPPGSMLRLARSVMVV
jgi:hypothetical protein